MPNLTTFVMERYDVDAEVAERIERLARTYSDSPADWPHLPMQQILPCIDSAAIDYCMWINDNTTVH